ncbi:hypothetical protein [Knoellia koreensis]|uniref:Uncharacterized protein n=1 Tax=Knoellia koreensis TaxID=2730921 RepID=A0A849HKT4_9MICO|nr:hypothetical protein [Knoellia sp. DB2414S]NNM47283.1 hypothetical protein [Knoellia sp. DB2414S]
MASIGSQPSGVIFPEVDGKRSTSALGRAVVADALRQVDPVGARAAERETNWRQGYLAHFRRMVEAGLLDDGEAAATIARDGLASLHERMRATGAKSEEVPLGDVFASGSADAPLETATVRGEGERATELSIPVHGNRLRGDDLHRQLDRWTAAGVMEPSAAEAVRTVMANPAWLDLSDRRLVVLGAGAEMGPLRAVLSWGGEVVGVDLPRADIWRRVTNVARSSAGTLHVPVQTGGGAGGDLAARAGADLLHGLPAIADWLTGIEGRLVLGNYVYADGATNVRVATAVDALSVELLRRRPDEVALAFLATPTDVFAVPTEAVEQSTRNYRSPSATMRLARPALRGLSGGRLLQRNYAPGSAPGVNDSLVPQQGPNYALAKRLQRWRATTAARDGIPVSLNVAPPTRTRSVIKNRALASAYAGAHRFGIEVFEPATSNTLMAALLVHDLRTGPRPEQTPWRAEADEAVHGGLWRTAYDPRSALGLAVVLGLGGARA